MKRHPAVQPATADMVHPRRQQYAHLQPEARAQGVAAEAVALRPLAAQAVENKPARAALQAAEVAQAVAADCAAVEAVADKRAPALPPAAHHDKSSAVAQPPDRAADWLDVAEEAVAVAAQADRPRDAAAERAAADSHRDAAAAAVAARADAGAVVAVDAAAERVDARRDVRSRVAAADRVRCRQAVDCNCSPPLPRDHTHFPFGLTTSHPHGEARPCDMVADFARAAHDFRVLKAGRRSPAPQMKSKYGETVNGAYPATRRKISEALVPPNPNEFDNTTSMPRLRDWCGTRSRGVSTEGLSRLSVGGAT